MKITIESTSKIVTLRHGRTGEDLQARVWEGVSEGGVYVQCFIPRIAAKDGQDLTQFERELSEQKKPSVEAEAIPLRFII